MIHLLLTADPLGFAAQGVAGYLFYVRAVCYAIAAVICIVGALSVYSDIIDGEPEVRIKIMRLAFSCVFLVSASTALPAFFGLDSTAANVEVSGTSTSYSGDSFPGLNPSNRFRGDDIFFPNVPHVVPLPDGGSAVIWLNDFDNRNFRGYERL